MAALSELALAAARAVMAVRKAPFAVRLKDDRSPVTDADEASQAILLEGLARLMPGVPVVSEEQADEPGWPQQDVFVLVDPLDGTREFVAGRDEFSVALGIVAQTVPVAGIIAAPVRERLWRGVVGIGAEHLACPGLTAGAPERITTRPFAGGTAVAVVSRSHLDTASSALLDRIGISERQPCGSALKFCLLAQGTADFYPRLAATSAWDVAAGHALLGAAGGVVTRPDGTPLRYGDGGTPGLRIPGFIACGDPALAARLA